MEHCLPSLAGRNHPRIWDAGVAMGQEPYTLSILFAERMGHFAFNNLRIDATDVESTGQFARMIEAGLYPQEELSRLPEGILEKYFEANGKPGHFRVIDKDPAASRLSTARSSFLARRSVMITRWSCARTCCSTSSPLERIEVLKMFHRALAPGGFFATEQTQEMPQELGLPVSAGDSRRATVSQGGGRRMRVVMLENSGRMYTSQVYLVLGDANRLEDVNTLVDVGQDPAILASIERAPTGVGKWPVEQVVLTHSHSDHCALLPEVRAAFRPRVLAFSPNVAWRRRPAARRGHHQHGRRGVRGDPHPGPQQRLDLPVQPVGRRAFRRRLAAADYLAGGHLRGRDSGRRWRNCAHAI